MEIQNNHGVAVGRIKLAIHQHQARGIGYYLALADERLDLEELRLRGLYAQTRRAFLLHPSAQWFLAADLMLAGAMAYSWGQQPSVFFGVSLLTAIVLAFWMTHARKSLFDGLGYLKGELRDIDAARAIRAAGSRQSSGFIGAIFNRLDSPRAERDDKNAV